MRWIRWTRVALLVVFAVCSGRLPGLGADEIVAERGGRRPSADESRASMVRMPSQVVGFRDVADFGLVFIDGQFLEPPYVVRSSGSSLTINGFEVSAQLIDDGELADGLEYVQLADGSMVQIPDSDRHLDEFIAGAHGSPGRSRGSIGVPLQSVSYRREANRPVGDPELRILEASQSGTYGVEDSIELARFESHQRITAYETAVALAESLHSGGVIVAFGQHPATVLMQPSRVRVLFETLLEKQGGVSKLDSVIVALAATDQQHQLWRDWLTTFRVSPELASTLRFELERLEQLKVENERQVAAVRRLDRFAYPLTVFGMLLGAFALGHMLRSSWTLQQPQVESHRPAAIRATELSLLFVVGMSLFDLTWTILAHQAGQMRELNPLGAGLVDSPEMLVGFKLLATLTGCGILYRFRSHVRCQTASWWMCLVCVLLTFRWVVLDYMFVA